MLVQLAALARFVHDYWTEGHIDWPTLWTIGSRLLKLDYYSFSLSSLLMGKGTTVTKETSGHCGPF